MNRRVLIYSHDSYGLGHLRRCREIAHALVRADEDVFVLVVSGSPVIGAFDFHPRVDFVRIPGVTKNKNGSYSAHKLPLRVKRTVALRSALIETTARALAPDLFLVDKEPLGLRGEVESTLRFLSRRGTPCVLGLRDVVDDQASLRREWARKKVPAALSELYDEIWVFGLERIYNPMAELGLAPEVLAKSIYTGYLRREVVSPVPGPEKVREPFVLVTVGGGGDGDEIVDWVLRAYESGADLPHPALIVLGPFMPPRRRARFERRARDLPRVEVLPFTSRIEGLMKRAVGVVAMGGYNTFCEILSLDKRALVVPRTAPRREQLVRAGRAQELGLARLMLDDGRRDAAVMAAALRSLPSQALPSERVIAGLLDGGPRVVELAGRWLRRPRRAATVAASDRAP